jgi:pimeloyl-ACP methyl ester carboxylesterase
MSAWKSKLLEVFERFGLSSWSSLLTKGRRIWGFGLGAGVLGAVVLAFRYALRPAPKTQLPDAISPAIFATRIFYSRRGQLVYHESGRGEPLLFLHGIYIGASSYEWSKVYPHFASAYQVMALDLIGFGESERPDLILSAADHVQALSEFLRAKSGGEPATIVASGQSAGFAVLLASQHPELVRRLILSMPTGALDSGQTRRRNLLLAKVPMANRVLYYRYLSTRVQVRSWLRNSGFADPVKVGDETVDVLSNCAQQFGAERAIFQWFSHRFDVELEKRIAEISQPVTLIWGDKAKYPPLESAYGLQLVVAKCSLIVLENTGTLAALETPERMTELLAKELDPTIRVYGAG